MMMNAKEIWERIKDYVNISEEEFFERVRKTSERADITERAAALLVAKRLGFDISDILRPPILGRVLEIGPVRESRGKVAYRIFTLVNREELRVCVAFGHEHVKRLEELEDKVVKVSKYILARTEIGELTRVTESSIIEEANDALLPPIYELPPARVATIAQLKDVRGYRIVTGVVIEQQTTQIWACPLCGKEVIPSDSEWVCSIHGPVEPEARNMHRLQLADRTGMYQAVYSGDLGLVEGSKLVVKAMFRGEELYISKVYKIEEVET